MKPYFAGICICGFIYCVYSFASLSCIKKETSSYKVSKATALDKETSSYKVNNTTPRVLLVTYAQNEPFVSSQQQIIKTQKDNSVDFIEAWNLERITAEFPQYQKHWEYPGKNRRPSCAFFKPVVVSDIMTKSNDGDWIIWVDSSKYYVNGIKGNMRDFVATLDKLGLDAFPGVALCGIANVDNRCVSIKTFRGLQVDIPKYWFAPHFQNNFFAFKKNCK